MTGNVWEWTSDWYGAHARPLRLLQHREPSVGVSATGATIRRSSG